MAGDPRLEWKTVEAGRFRVHFHGGLERTAQRVARFVAHVEDEVVKIIGARPVDTTEILLTDSSDAANGLSSVLPYSRVILYATAPDDMSGLGEYDDWLSTLVAHEDTHIVHMGSISGLPALLNAVVGKQAVPNQLQPRWLLEGLAVYAETRLSGGGRLRAPAFDMMLRADVLDGDFATLDQISGAPLRWPPGIYYLYGAKFVEFLANLYGPTVLAAAVQDAGDAVMPFAVSRPFYRATGRTIEELYVAFRGAAERRVAEQMDVVVRRGLREGRPLTRHGRTVSHPRFVPARCRRGGGAPQGDAATSDAAIVYFRDDGHARPGYYELALGEHGEPGAETLITRASGENVSVGPDCSLWFESAAPSRRFYDFNDLFLQLPGTTSPSGVDESRKRITVGRRATDPDISVDGRHLVYVTNRAGTTTLRIATWNGDTLQDERALVPSAASEQVFTPRFSPDGKRVVYAVWTTGGFRDWRIVSLETGHVFQPWKDRATDQQPRFSPDGKWIYFSSDRSGISNIYAYHLERSELWQVTNVRTGAFMPELSQDGRQLVYVGYGSRGYDLFSLSLDEGRFLRPMPASNERDDRVILDQRGDSPVERYSALSTIRPRALAFDYQSDNTSQRLVVSTSSSDIVGRHGISATAYFKPEGDSPDLYLRYEYGGLPVDVFAQGYRRILTRNNYSYGSLRTNLDMVQTGLSTGVSIPFPGEFEYQSVRVEYAAERVDAILPTGDAADPYAPIPDEPRRALVSNLRLSYYFSNLESSTYGVGRERGIECYLALDEAHRGLGSQLEGTSAYGRLSGYLPMPWLRHHVLALSGTVGASTGDAGAVYRLGGYPESDLLRNIVARDTQDRTALRGYPYRRFVGRRLLLGQAEYRFPIYLVDRGISTLPLFMRYVGGALGVDAGGAFNNFDPHAFDESIHYGFSGELWLDFVFAYRMPMHFVLGYAAGMGVGAYDGGTSYFILGSRL